MHPRFLLQVPSEKRYVLLNFLGGHDERAADEVRSQMWKFKMDGTDNMTTWIMECLECNCSGQVLSQGVPPIHWNNFIYLQRDICPTSSDLPLGIVQHALEPNRPLQFPEAFLQPEEEQWKASWKRLSLLFKCHFFTLAEVPSSSMGKRSVR